MDTANVQQHVLTLPDALEKAQWDEKIEVLFQQQMQTWPLAYDHYQQFKQVKKRSLNFEDFRLDIQYNPARERSTCADLHPITIEKRPCFLCQTNLPLEQKGYVILKKYLMLINPYPIFDRHLTISALQHQVQNIQGRIIDMLTLAKDLQGFTIFYNGPRCGASAPDHFHFQAVNKHVMPIDTEFEYLKKFKSKLLVTEDDIEIVQLKHYLRKTVVFESEYREPIDFFFTKVLQQLPVDEASNEPMMNLLASYQQGKYRLTLFLRNKQRPSFYYREEPDRIMVSPASVEMGGLIVVPRESDYLKITKEDLREIFSETCLNLNINDILNI
jgi:ATP adenylyltransferase/5',5'''-P-1,P-4-tetraphosphate phosphorylase II